jgi:hypothetical protein
MVCMICRRYRLFLILGISLFIQKVEAQFMPLDLSEMLNRSRIVKPQYSNYDSSVSHVGLDISVLVMDQPSIFIVPYYRGDISSDISFYYKLFITNNPNYGQRIGSRYERTGGYTGAQKPGDVSILESYFQYAKGSLLIKAGKLHPANSQYKRLELQHNFFNSAIYGFIYHMKFQQFKFTQAHYWLGYSSAGDIVEGYSRYYATQHLAFRSKYIDIEVGGRVIYAGLNQAVNWRYLAPLDPFILSVFNLGTPRNNDNHVIDLSLAIKPIHNISIIAKMVVDEFQVDYADRLIHDDDWGYQISISRIINSHYLKQIAINQLYASDYLGIHYEESTNYEIYGLPILSSYGPQVKRIELVGHFECIEQRVAGWIAFYSHSSGNKNIIGSNWNPKATSEDNENWKNVIGLEMEVMVHFYKRYYSFLHMEITETNHTVLMLSLTHSL